MAKLKHFLPVDFVRDQWKAFKKVDQHLELLLALICKLDGLIEAVSRANPFQLKMALDSMVSWVGLLVYA